MREILDFEKLLPVLREEILCHFCVDSCIVSTKIFIELMEKFKLNCTAVSVRALIFNREFLAEKDLGRPPLNNNLAWSVSIGSGHEGIHLVALLEGTYLIDLSIDQASRPDKNIVIDTPLWLKIDKNNLRDFLEAKIQLFKFYNGLKISYVAWPNRETHLKSNNWGSRDAKIRKQIVNKIYKIFR